MPSCNEACPEHSGFDERIKHAEREILEQWTEMGVMRQNHDNDMRSVRGQQTAMLTIQIVALLALVGNLILKVL